LRWCYGILEPRLQLVGGRSVRVDTMNMRLTTCVGNELAHMKNMSRMTCADSEPAEKVLNSSFVGLVSVLDDA
jgi:hypothetical protein